MKLDIIADFHFIFLIPLQPRRHFARRIAFNFALGPDWPQLAAGDGAINDLIQTRAAGFRIINAAPAMRVNRLP
jgi:hypothetical protein